MFINLKQQLVSPILHIIKKDKFQLYLCERTSCTYVSYIYSLFKKFKKFLRTGSISMYALLITLKHYVSNYNISVLTLFFHDHFLSYMNCFTLTFFWGGEWYCCCFQINFLYQLTWCENKWVWSNVKCICQMKETEVQ